MEQGLRRREGLLHASADLRLGAFGRLHPVPESAFGHLFVLAALGRCHLFDDGTDVDLRLRLSDLYALVNTRVARVQMRHALLPLHHLVCMGNAALVDSGDGRTAPQARLRVRPNVRLQLGREQLSRIAASDEFLPAYRLLDALRRRRSSIWLL